MTLTKEIFIRNRVELTPTEKDTLASAQNIIDNIKYENTHSAGTEDDYLYDICTEASRLIGELLDDYSNEYAGKKN